MERGLGAQWRSEHGAERLAEKFQTGDPLVATGLD